MASAIRVRVDIVIRIISRSGYSDLWTKCRFRCTVWGHSKSLHGLFRFDFPFYRPCKDIINLPYRQEKAVFFYGNAHNPNYCTLLKKSSARCKSSGVSIPMVAISVYPTSMR